MSFPGGPANKLGNRYEQWWTVLQLMRVVRGTAITIEIEKIALDFAEFVVETPTATEYHQARLSHPTGKWTLAALSDVLRPAIRIMAASPTATFTFVSRSDARELEELVNRARSVPDFDSYKSQALRARTHESNFRRFVEFCPDRRPETAFAVLQRIQVTTIDEDRLRQLVSAEAQLDLSGPNSSALDRLRCLVSDSIHCKLDRDAILSDLGTIGVGPRPRRGAADTSIEAVTDSYLQSAARRLIHARLLPTPTVSELVGRILKSSNSTSLLVTGGAGSGKSATLYGAVSELRARDPRIPILALRLDRADPTPSADELGRRLGLGKSPALSVGAAAEQAAGHALLVVDQLDAVSTVSGRRSEFLDSVEQILEDIKALRTKLKIHVVLACRKFDWANDHRLRRLLPTDVPHVTPQQWSDDQIRAALTRAGFDASLFYPRQVELLRLPLHLALLLDSAEGPAPPAFSSANDLFNLYWKAKRTAVNTRAAPVTDHWASLIERLSDAMSESQQLSVPVDVLDELPEEYVVQASSEGVIAVDHHRVAFWHESFFDYCFARTFVRADRSLVSFLVASEQQLFRRAQVRQVLQYLRDADLSRYCRELRTLLLEPRVRWHVKDVAVAVAMSVADPSRQEWELFEHWVEAWFTNDPQQTQDTELVRLVGRHFLGSDSWFLAANDAGLIRQTLESEDTRCVESALDCLSRRQEQRGDMVAELLNPYVAGGEAWNTRFFHFFRHARLGESRQLFDLFLILLRNGTLDPSLDEINAEAPFWFQVDTLADQRPEWVPEVLAAWLQRIQIREPSDAKRWLEHFHQAQRSVHEILQAAKARPRSFVRHLLPRVLEIAEISSTGDEPPVRDPIWSVVVGEKHVFTVSGAIRRGLIDGLTELAAAHSEKGESHVTELQSSRLYLANWLLLATYAAAGRELTDRAARELCANPWRFDCGPVSNPYWTARQLVTSIAPHCSASALADLEKTILEYRSDYEKSPAGRSVQGWASFNLLSGIPRELRSWAAQRRYQEWERKFHKPHPPPSDPEAVMVGSPIEREQAAKMNDEQWLRAIAKHDRRRWDPADISKGGPAELAHELAEHVRTEPERFAKLILRTPAETNPHYIASVLRALKDCQVGVSLDGRLKVIRKAYSEHLAEVGGEIADLLGAATEELPDEAVAILASLATDHPHPPGSWHETWDPGTGELRGHDLISAGINTTRGKAAGAVAQLIQHDRRYAKRFRAVAERIVRDSNPAVRAVAGALICNLAAIDSDWAFRLYVVLLSGKPGPEEDTLLATPYVRRFLEWDVRRNFVRQRPYVLRALHSEAPDVNQVGAEVACTAVLLGSNASDLVEMAHTGSTAHRRGIVLVVVEVLRFREHREWAEAQLTILFDDADRNVQRIAASCFRSLEGSPLEDYEALIMGFCSSRAFPRHADDLLRALEKSSHRLPGIVCTVLIGLLERSNEEAWHIPSAAYISPNLVVKLVLRIYHQHPHSEWTSTCLDLLDRMSMSGGLYVKSALEDYER